MKKIIFILFIFCFPLTALAATNDEDKAVQKLLSAILRQNGLLIEGSIADSMEEFAPLAHKKEYDKLYFSIQKCYQTAPQFNTEDAQYKIAIRKGAQCIGADYATTRAVNDANQQAEKNGQPKPYNIPFFEWSAFEKRMEKIGIPKEFILLKAKDMTTEKVNSFSPNYIKQTNGSERNAFISFNYCPVYFNALLHKIYALP